MIIGDNREKVIENICSAAGKGEFHIKVELNDPVLTAEQSNEIINTYLSNCRTSQFRMKSFVARQMANALTHGLNKDTEIVGLEHIEGITGGAIITCNHFSPVDNTVVRHLTRKLGKKRINIVSQETNLAMPGMVGFLMNYADIIPINGNPRYLRNEFEPILAELLRNDEYVLIYPEQEMWFNYRKPRPLKRGAYVFAAKLNVPIISCFVEMRDTEENDTEDFRRVQYVIHVLPTLYPDPEKSVKENSLELCRMDYEQKKQAYEAAYGKELDYAFESTDIAGWIADSRPQQSFLR